MLLVSVALLGVITFLLLRFEATYMEGQPPILTRLDIYEYGVTYRTGIYTTMTALAVGLEAAPRDPPQIVELHYCDGTDKLEEVLELLRSRETFRFGIVLPEDC